MTGASGMAVGLPRPDGWEVQVYHGDMEICAVVPAVVIAEAVGEGATHGSVRSWLMSSATALRHAAIARAAGRHAAKPFDGLRILGSVSCR